VRETGREIYIVQATTDTRPEDLLVTPVLGPDGGVRYMASPLVTAMVRGGACILDEGNRMSEKSWASLAPLLDHRRSVDSVVAGITIAAHADFRFATTMNEDASTYEVPEYIHSRLMPQIVIDFPDEDEERAILETQVAGADDEVVAYVLSFLRAAHLADLRYSVRDGINVARYAMKLLSRREAADARHAVDTALRLALGEDEAEPFRLTD
jgi:MoxR-like ATPase